MSIRSIFSNSKSYFQSLTILSSSLILTTSLVTFGLPKVSVNAGRGNIRNILYRVVTHPNGVNLRNKGCEIIGKAGYGEILISITDSGEQIATTGCNINGEKNMEMVNYGTRKDYINANDGEMAIKGVFFVSTRYTRAVNSGTNGTYKNQDKVRLNNPDGVNLRDENCQRVMTLPNETYSENPSDINVTNYVFSPGLKICKAGGEFYSMIPFVYKGKSYQVAEVLTKYE